MLPSYCITIFKCEIIFDSSNLNEKHEKKRRHFTLKSTLFIIAEAGLELAGKTL
jgi:phage-related protein